MGVARASRGRLAQEAEARQVAEELGFGPVKLVKQGRTAIGWLVVPGALMAPLGIAAFVLGAGLPLLAPLYAHAYTVFPLFFGSMGPGLLLASYGMRARKTGRLMCYPEGLVLVNPEPSVIIRWADVDQVEVTFIDDSDDGWSAIRLTVRDATGTTVVVDDEYGGGGGWLDVAWEARHVLAPRMTAELIRMLDSGEPVSIGSAGITPDGVGAVPWSRIRSVRAEQANGLAHGVTLGLDDGSEVGIDLAGVPNGIFIPGLLEHVTRESGQD
jgi:hypothetical protein